eukprot:gene19355-22005_t
MQSSIKYCDIPQYLERSAFYLSLNEEDKNGELQIPAQCFKPDDIVATVDDFVQLLRVIQFWGVDQIPLSMIKFCLCTSFSEWATSIPDFMKEVELVVDLRYIFKKSADSVLSKSIEKGRTEIVDHLVLCSKENGHFDPAATMAAAKWGRLGYLQMLHNNGFPWHEETCSAAAAAQSGSVACLEYLVRNRSLPYGLDAFGAAFTRAHFECVQFMLTYTTSKFVRFYSYDHDQYIEFLFALPTSKYSRKEFDERLLKCIQCALEHGWQWDSNIVSTAFNNNFEKCKAFMKQEGWT